MSMVEQHRVKTILYVVSTLRACGPTKQLSYIVKYLDRSVFNIHLVTLSPEEPSSRQELFIQLGLTIHNLDLSRVKGFYLAKKRLKQLIARIKPDIIHTQGWRPDSILSSIPIVCPWVATSRNNPWEDYPMKFGRVIGSCMAMQHISSLRKCKNVVSCSYTMKEQLAAHRVIAKAIPNGVEFDPENCEPAVDLTGLEKPVFITVGSLIARKNIEFILSAFDIYSKSNKGSLVILGDGPQKCLVDKFVDRKRVFGPGSVEDVAGYIKASDLFVSASLSEGLPNAVLEAIYLGLPALISDIPPHIEIKSMCPDVCEIFCLKNGPAELAGAMVNMVSTYHNISRTKFFEEAKSIISAKRMAGKYKDFYLSCMESHHG